MHLANYRFLAARNEHEPPRVVGVEKLRSVDHSESASSAPPMSEGIQTRLPNLPRP